MIKIQSVTMGYVSLNAFNKGRFTALHNASMVIERGDRVAFMGPNGAGKTTLLKLIGGLIFPTQGDIWVNHFHTVRNNLQARSMVGYVLSDTKGFYVRLTGRHNLHFFGTLNNLFGNRLNQRIDELLHTVGLAEAADKLFGSYSSGMKQRLAIARGLLARPQVLILDEPTRALDPLGTEKIHSILLEKIYNNETEVLLLASHSANEAAALCNKVCIIDKGHVLAYGNIDDLTAAHGSLEAFYKMVMKEDYQEFERFQATLKS